MRDLKIQGVHSLTVKEAREITGGFWVYVRAVAKALAAVAAYNDLCGGCVTERINNSDDSLGGSRPFE